MSLMLPGQEKDLKKAATAVGMVLFSLPAEPRNALLDQILTASSDALADTRLLEYEREQIKALRTRMLSNLASAPISVDLEDHTEFDRVSAANKELRNKRRAAAEEARLKKEFLKKAMASYNKNNS